MVLSVLVGQALRKLPKQSTARCCFVDDLLLGAKSQEELDAAIKALKEYFANLSAGPLTLTVKGPYDLSPPSNQAIYYLGYKVWLDKFTGEFRICPSKRSFGRMKKRIRELVVSSFEDGLSHKIIEIRVLGYATNWSQQFHLWDKTESAIDLLEITALTALNDTLDSLSSN